MTNHLKDEIRTRLEYATTSGENLDYAVNSIEELILQDNKKVVEGERSRIVKIVEGMKCNQIEDYINATEGGDVPQEDAIAEYERNKALYDVIKAIHKGVNIEGITIKEN